MGKQVPKTAITRASIKSNAIVVAFNVSVNSLSEAYEGVENLLYGLRDTLEEKKDFTPRILNVEKTEAGSYLVEVFFDYNEVTKEVIFRGVLDRSLGNRV